MTEKEYSFVRKKYELEVERVEEVGREFSELKGRLKKLEEEEAKLIREKYSLLVCYIHIIGVTTSVQ